MYEQVTAAIADLDAINRNKTALQQMLADVLGGASTVVTVNSKSVVLTAAQVTPILNAAITQLNAQWTASKTKLDAAALALG